MYRGAVAHTGDLAAEAPISEKPELLWKFTGLNKGIHTASKSSPAVDDKALYVGADNGYFYAFDRFDGRMLWFFRARKSNFGIHSSPAVDGDTVYFGAYNGYLYALDKNTGALKWRRKLGGSIGSSPVLFEDKIYIGVELARPNRGFLAVVRRSDGKKVFYGAKFPEHTHATPTIDERARTVFIGANSGSFYMYDCDTGKLLFEFKSAGAIKSTAALSDKMVFFTSWDSNLYALDRGNLALKWKVSIDNWSMSSPAVDESEGKVYFGSHDRHLYCVDLETGSKIWSFFPDARIISSPVIASAKGKRAKVVLFGADDDRLYMLDPADGKALWFGRLDGDGSSLPVLKDSVIYYSSNNSLYAFK